jgi:HEAT repeat protein
MLIQSLLVFVILSTYSESYSAKYRVDSMSKILNELRVPFNERIKRLNTNKNDNDFVDLVKVVETKKYSLQAKWNSILTLGAIFPERSKPYLKEWLKSPFWLIRNASLLAMKKADPKIARSYALQLLNDNSLVLRTAAVNTLAETGQAKDVEYLKKAFYSSQNIYKKQSLWVRHHIVSAIAKLDGENSVEFLYQNLNNSDKRIEKAAVKALEELYPKKAARFKKLKFEKRKLSWLKSVDKVRQ